MIKVPETIYVIDKGNNKSDTEEEEVSISTTKSDDNVTDTTAISTPLEGEEDVEEEDDTMMEFDVDKTRI